LKNIRNDCDLQIKELERLRSNRNRTNRHYQSINELALELYNKDPEFFDNTNKKDATAIVQKHMLCSGQRALQTYERLRAWSLRKKKKDRNQQIILLANAGEKKAVIARRFNISRQQVHNVLAKNKKEIFLKY
jgi:hypothetical protein